MPHLSAVRTKDLFTTLAAIVITASSVAAHAVPCHIRPASTPSTAEQAYLKGDFTLAATEYEKELAQHPDDPTATVGMVQVLLRQQKVKEADTLVHKALLANPKSATLTVALGEVQYREGDLWLVGPTVVEAEKLDPCEPRVHLLTARLLRLNSLYKSAANQIQMAHNLDPHDPKIRLQWLEDLPFKERVANLEAYLASSNGDDPEDLRHLHSYLDYLKKVEVEPHKPCRLVSDTSSTSIPFASLLRDATHIRAFGLDVKLNNHSSRLEIDTGAGGIVISRAAANRAGLKQFSQSESSGIGDHGNKRGYTAYADNIKIGALEFQDCEVEVIEQGDFAGADGLIGMDVFSRFLVTLDYPMRKLLLGPLPPRPDDVAAAKPSLQTNTTDKDPDGETPDASAKAVTRGPRDRYVAPEMKDWTRVYRLGHDLLLPASLNDSHLKLFILDTGAFATTITPSAAREVTKVHSDDSITVKGISGKVEKVYSADNITFKFANLSQKVTDVVAFDTPQVSRSLGMEVSGFIGFTALGQCTMSIDYRDGLVKFSYDANRGYKIPPTY